MTSGDDPPGSRSGLVPPWGGQLVDLCVRDARRRDELRAVASTARPLELSERSQCDLELLATGAYSPLRAFLGLTDVERVLDEMRLADGTLWSMPITLPVP